MPYVPPPKNPSESGDEENSLPRYRNAPPPPPKKEITNAEIRAGLYKLLPLFLERNCQYNDGERVLVKRLMESLEPVNSEFEKYNEEHPGHGLPNQKP